MDAYTMSELAYKNGYAKGYKDALKDLLNKYSTYNMSVPDVIDELIHERNLEDDEK